jgi:glycosyltransferase involved in cell wall biosynthesis
MEQAAAGFGIEFDWDIPLLEGYSYSFLTNVARDPSVFRFTGLDTPEIKETVASERYDAVIVNGWHYKSAWQAIWACWHTKTPVMVRGDSHLYAQRHPLEKALKWLLYRRFIPKFDACLAVGKWSREYYLHYGARPDRVFLVPHVVDNGWFVRESARLIPQRAELLRHWGLDEEATVFLFVGKFVEVKRPMDFVLAVDHAARRGAPVMGLMVGDGPLRPPCEAFVRRNGAPVRFAGFLNQSQVVRSYIAAGALVLPSEGETWGLVVNEAMACGRPCIVSDKVGCAPDLVIHGETGAIFPMGNVEALTELLAFYAADPKTLKMMGNRARERVTRNSIHIAVEGVIEALAAIKANEK